MSLTSPAAQTTMRGPLTVQNNMRNKTVFSKVINGNSVNISLGAKGEDDDTQRFPLAVAEDIDFINSIAQGVITVIDGPQDVVEFLQDEGGKVRLRQVGGNEAARLEGVIDRQQDRDILSHTCIGPAAGGREGTCGKELLQSAKQQGQVPPLCKQHEHLAPNFTFVETGGRGLEASGASESSAGVVRREWRPVTITERRQAE